MRCRAVRGDVGHRDPGRAGLVAVPFIVVFRRRYLAAGERLNSELELEGTSHSPGKGVYRGATHPATRP